MGITTDIKRQGRVYWWLVFIGVPIAIGLGTFGYWVSMGASSGARAWVDALYNALQLLFLRLSPLDHIHWTLEVARWMTVLLVGLAGFMTFYKVFWPELQQIWLQIYWPRHVVILGLGPMTTQLVHCFHKQGKLVVVVAPTADDEGVEACQGKGIMLVTGDLAKQATLVKARAYRASHLIALSAEDSTNVAIIDEARKLIQKKVRRREGQDPVKCFVHLSDVDARTALQTSKVFGGDPRFDIRFFDLFDAAVRSLLLDPKQMPLDRGGIRKDDPRQVHLVILGFGRMGRTVALRAAQLGHFANQIPLRISVIDQQARQLEQALLFRYPNFGKSCQIDFHALEVESLSARQLLENWCADQTCIVNVAVCFDRDSLALEVALRMKAKVDELQVPLFVRMSSQAGFAVLLQNGAADLVSQVHAFGMIEDCCSDEFLENKLNEDLARAIHEDYQREKIKTIQSKGGDPSKDISTRAWHQLDEGLKDSNRQQADHIDIKLRAIGLERCKAVDPRPPVEHFEEVEVELLAQMEHNRWNAERWLQGWTLGPSNKPKKITPYLVPWTALPEDIKPYDRTTVSKIPEFLRAVGQKVCQKVAKP